MSSNKIKFILNTSGKILLYFFHSVLLFFSPWVRFVLYCVLKLTKMQSQHFKSSCIVCTNVEFSYLPGNCFHFFSFCCLLVLVYSFHLSQKHWQLGTVDVAVAAIAALVCENYFSE